VSYFARLREQSRLTVLSAEAPRQDTPREAAWADPPGHQGDLHLADVVEVPAPVAAAAAAPPDARAAEPPRPATPSPRQDRPAPERRHESDRVADADRAGHHQVPASSAAARDETRPPRDTSAPHVEPARAGGTREPELTPSRDATLRHVFEWLSAPPVPVDEHQAGALQGVDAPASRHADSTPVAAIRSVAVSAPRAEATRTLTTRPRPHPARRPESDDVEIVDHGSDRRVQRNARDVPAMEAAAPPRDSVEEAITVSIGAINVRVDAPVAPAVSLRPAAAAKPGREARRPGSRLARHYLRP
jgi:hypothetical protein